MLALLCYLSVVILGVTGQGAPSPDAGSVEFVLKMMSPIYVCADKVSTAYVDTSELILELPNDTMSFISGDINFLKAFPERAMMEIVVDKEANGRYEMVMSHEICDVCAEMENPESSYADQFKYFGFPDKCPFPAGKYSIHNMMADLEEVPKNSANAGCYMVQLNIYVDDSVDCTGDSGDRQFMGCMKLEACIEPI